MDYYDRPLQEIEHSALLYAVNMRPTPYFTNYISQTEYSKMHVNLNIHLNVAAFET